MGVSADQPVEPLRTAAVTTGSGAPSVQDYPDDSTPGRSLLARAAALPARLTPGSGQGVRGGVERATAVAVRGALTTWVQVGMLVRRARGAGEPLAGANPDQAFAFLAGLAECAVDGSPLPVTVSPEATRTTHVRLVATSMPVHEAMDAVTRALQPYAAASSTTTTPPVAVGYFAVRQLLARRAQHFSLQVVHLTPPGWVEEPPGLRDETRRPFQMSVQLPREVPLTDVQAERAAPADAEAWLAEIVRSAALTPTVRRLDGEDAATAFGWGPAGGTADDVLPDDEDADTEQLSVAATLPASVTDVTALRLVAGALHRLAGTALPPARLQPATRLGDLLVEGWAGFVGDIPVEVTVAARTGTRRRLTQVVVTARGPGILPAKAPPPDATFAVPSEHEASAVRLARELAERPIWWRSVGGRLDGDDVILYEAVSAGQRLRVRANDYPAEPMYTLIVGLPGAVLATLDLERWPSEWTRPMLS